MEDLEQLKTRTKKLNTQAAWGAIPEVADKVYQACAQLSAARKRLAAAGA